MSTTVSHYLRSVINSYAILFFSQNSMLGTILLVVSFFNPYAGITGLLCVIGAIAYTSVAGFPKRDVREGLFSFNPLLFGIGMGTFYHFNAAFWVWTALGCLICIFINILLYNWSVRLRLPFLSLPFIITFWLAFSAANSVFAMQLNQRFSVILNELSAAGGGHHHYLTAFEQHLHLPFYLGLLFRSLSAVLFQDNTLSGLLISAGILIHSRIAFSMMLLGFIAAVLFTNLMHIYPEGISAYHLGSNMLLPAMAIGSFFLIPSLRSYLWAMVMIPLAVLLISALTRVAGVFDLPVLSLPFFALTATMLAVFKLQPGETAVVLTPFQFYVPEDNLYQYHNRKDRLKELRYLNIKLPFMGKWLVSQAYHGDVTHKDEWAHALDFVIQNEDHHTFKQPGNLPEHYYCFNKPVLACADGIVEEITDHVEDNRIGQVNMRENWGNSLVIRHTAGLYSSVSHLKQYSIKVKPGDFVRQGDIIGLCGNSGRSPQPHLHFQLQSTPYIGSRTLSYPLSSYLEEDTLHSFDIPELGMEVEPLQPDPTLKRAFTFLPGYLIKATAGDGRAETLEVKTDAYNQLYFYSIETEATAYFISNDVSVSFTSFSGSKRSLLYLFYLSAYKVIFTGKAPVHDVYPLQLLPHKAALWFQDVLAPFYRYIRLDYESSNRIAGHSAIVESRQTKKLFNRDSVLMDARININNNTITEFTVNRQGQSTTVKWAAESIY